MIAKPTEDDESDSDRGDQSQVERQLQRGSGDLWQKRQEDVTGVERGMQERDHD